MRWDLRGQTKGKSTVGKSNIEWRKTNHQSSNEKDVNMMTIMSLARESKIKGIDESEVWKKLLKHRWESDILKTDSSCSDENQRAEVIYKTTKDLKINYDSSQWIPEKDIRLGTELYSVFSCPESLIEAAKLSKFFESLITDENLNTVVAATMHNIQPRAGDNIKDSTADSP